MQPFSQGLTANSGVRPKLHLLTISMSMSFVLPFLTNLDIGLDLALTVVTFTNSKLSQNCFRIKALLAF